MLKSTFLFLASVISQPTVLAGGNAAERWDNLLFGSPREVVSLVVIVLSVVVLCILSGRCERKSHQDQEGENHPT